MAKTKVKENDRKDCKKKTQAEIQKAYRERKKATGGKEYLKKGMSKGKAVEVAYVY